jgi:uncharacterized membrane protein YoaK (UPF0700 family)/anti-anti-sigma regulatory factor
MLSADAYSFRLKSRLAISLSWIAGFTNVVTLIAFGQVVSHQTGNSTHVGLAVGQMMLGIPGAAREAMYFGFLLGAFLLGAMASAFMTEGARRAGWASKYIMPMSVEGMLLSIFLILMLHHPHLEMTDYENLYAMTGVAAFAMGLQNATITKISGAIVRTTHLTGVITDFGLESVQLFLWWRDKVHSAKAGRYGRMLKVSRRHPTVLRVLLLASIFASFLFGTVLGTVAFIKLGPPALLAPVLFLVMIVLIDYFTPIADVREIDPTRDKELTGLFGNLKALLPADVGIFRLAHHKAGRLHKAPDFSAWTDRIPHHWRVIILVISPLTQFDSDSAMSLLTAVQRLGAHGRTMVISGMNRAQFKTLMACGLAKSIDLDNFVPDLEYAIARGMNLAENLKKNNQTTV